jgi:hypothetical protein
MPIKPGPTTRTVQELERIRGTLPNNLSFSLCLPLLMGSVRADKVVVVDSVLKKNGDPKSTISQPESREEIIDSSMKEKELSNSVNINNSLKNSILKVRVISMFQHGRIILDSGPHYSGATSSVFFQSVMNNVFIYPVRKSFYM